MNELKENELSKYLEFFLNSCPLTFNTLCNVNWRRYLLMYFSEYMYRFIVYFKKYFKKYFH